MHNQLCPVAAVLKYMVEKGLSKGPLFVFKDRKLLIHKWFVRAICEVLATAGIDTSKYCSHSFWIWFATTAAEWGIQDTLIRMMGRWESSVYLLYICTPGDKICVVAKTLLGDHQ